MREAVMSGMVLADDSLINLFPDPAWDVAGFRDLAGGVIAVCLYAAVAMVIVGVLTLLPGLITNNMMERAFSWKRLLCALMIPLTIGAATGGFAWGAGAFGADGLAVNDSYQSANGHPDWKGVKNDEAKKSDDLGDVVRQLGEDIANRVGKAAGDAIDKALSTGKKAWQWLSGGDGKGNVFQKAGDAASGAWDWLSGGDGKGNVFEKTGRPAGVLGVWGQVGSRAQVVEGSGVEVVGTPFHGACYLFDPERRRATAVLALKVEEWTLSTDASKSSRAAALNDLTARLADTPGVVELKETALLLPGAAPAPDLPDDGGSPEWMRRDMAELWALPEVMTPLANVSYVSVTCDVDRLKGVDRARGRLTERDRVGVALGDLVKMTVAPALVECGARPGSVRWCGLDDLRTLIRSVSDPAGNADRPPVTRDEPTLGWCEESLDGESVTLESCVARTWWVTQWPDRPVPAGWTRDILQGGRMIALTHIWRPMSMEESEKDLRDRESSILQRDTLQNQRKLSRDERRERREQRQREAEQDANWPDTDHQGYIALFAPDRDMLAVFERDLRVRVGKYHLRLSGLRGQQRQALTAVLPLGL